jgi:nucleoid DNA-binding protein
MTKRDLVVNISAETGMIQDQVCKVVQRTLDHISGAVAEGATVELRNFGIFEVQVRKARIGRNPMQPETKVLIPKRVVVKFRPGKDMREAVNKLSPVSP